MLNKVKMADIKKKRIVLTLQQKFDAIRLLDWGMPAYKIAKDLGIQKTNSEFIKNVKMSNYQKSCIANIKATLFSNWKWRI